MLILASILIVTLGIILLFAPDAWWEITESWKSYSASEPSDMYLKLTRISGIISLLAGISGILVALFA